MIFKTPEEKELRRVWSEYLKEGQPRRYNFSRLFSAYNNFFNKRERNPLCSSCIARVVRNTRTWIKNN